MTVEAAAGTTAPHGSRAILYGGLVAGAMDLTYAIVASALRGFEPVRLLQSISTGLFGAAAYEHGAATAGLGVLLHFLMMFIICAIYYAASRRIPLLVQRPIVMGLLYGVVVYVVMNYVVLPLSAFPHGLPPSLTSIAIGAAAMLFCVGIPIALIVRRFG